MRTLSLVLLSTVLPATALAWDSVAPDVKFEGETQMYRGAENAVYYELADWLPVELGFSHDSEVLAGFEMFADSEVTWPTALTHTWEGIVQGGSVKTEVETTIGAYVRVNLSSSSIDIPLWEREFNWTGAQKFDSLLLPGGINSATVIVQPELITLDYTFEDALYAITGDPDMPYINITLGGTLSPSIETSLTGRKVTTNAVEIATEDGTGLLDVPEQNPGIMGLEAVWEGDASSDFDLDFMPWISLSGDFSTPNPIGVTIPVWDVADDESKIASDPVEFDHDLPALSVNSSIDVGNVYIGESTEVTVDLQNIGALDLEGEAAYTGDAAFELVGGADFYAGGNTADTVTLAFSPDVEGEFSGTLILDSNDPITPTVEVPVHGAGIVPDVDDPNGDGGGEGDLATRGCGCSSTPATAPSGLLAFGLLGLLGLRRRRNA